ncbi:MULTISPECIES: alpha/beta hydrolase [unclassified Sphingomonas]|uniref:alpha/beta hydrolase n=1 Tax=unclassified Sphingomonas TaxID=196159 RepID=UPI002269F94C|nr:MULTISPECIES: alpha/beta hydrolase [unclassified Sphingomonas]
MGITTHDEYVLDRAAMLAMRGFMKLSAAPPIAPEGRPGYDELMARTPAPDGVTWTPGEAGGVSGWWCRPVDAIPGRAILYLHGGCYVIGSATAYRGFASQIAARAKAATFVAEYGLAPEHPFPAAFDDARRALDGLRSAGFGSVALAGDSAGGGLGLALIASGTAAVRPVAAALFSPWIDLSLAGETMDSRADVDPILSRTLLEQGASQYLSGADPQDFRANAMSRDLSGLPPIRIDVGDDEVLLDDSRRFGKIADAAGILCEVHIWKGMVHVFPANVSMLKAAPEALDGAGMFLDAAFAKATAA